MNKVTWKRKKSNISLSTAPVFSKEDSEEDVDSTEIVDDWRSLVPSKKKAMLEDRIGKSKRLIQEAVQLAEEARYWESIQRFDQAIDLHPDDPKVYEMKAQALLEVGELFPAIQAAEKSVLLDPAWAEGYQTLGRAQISVGEIKMALKSFSKAYHLNPTLEGLYKEDLCWAKELLQKKKEMTVKAEKTPSTEGGERGGGGCQKCGKCFVKVEEKPMKEKEEKESEPHPVGNDEQQDYIYEQFKKRLAVANYDDMIEMFNSFNREDKKLVFGGELRMVSNENK